MDLSDVLVLFWLYNRLDVVPNLYLSFEGLGFLFSLLSLTSLLTLVFDYSMVILL